METVFHNHNMTRVLAETLIKRIDPTVPSTEMEGKALAIYKAPFTCHEGYIFDADGEMVVDNGGNEQTMAQVRGWGRITYMENPEKLQDAVGDIIAKALTLYWDLHADDEGEEK